MQRQFDFPDPAQGRVFNLRALFDKLNARYFRNRLRGYTIVWGRKRPGRPRNGIVFATIQEEDRLIRIHPLLDRSFIPTWFLEYVIYHEMCHAVVRDQYDPRRPPHRPPREILCPRAALPLVPPRQDVGAGKSRAVSPVAPAVVGGGRGISGCAGWARQSGADSSLINPTLRGRAICSIVQREFPPTKRDHDAT